MAEGKIKSIEIDVKDTGSVVRCYRKTSAAAKKRDVYASEWDNKEEFAFSDSASAVAKVTELLAEIK